MAYFLLYDLLQKFYFRVDKTAHCLKELNQPFKNVGLYRIEDSCWSLWYCKMSVNEKSLSELTKNCKVTRCLCVQLVKMDFSVARTKYKVVLPPSIQSRRRTCTFQRMRYFTDYAVALVLDPHELMSETRPGLFVEVVPPNDAAGVSAVMWRRRTNEVPKSAAALFSPC